MLIYLGKGVRRYEIAPIPVVRRGVWEFQAVLQGEIGLRLERGQVRFRHRRLWIFPPGHPHGWSGRGRTPAEVAVFHFDHVPEPLRAEVAEREFAEVALTPSQCARLRKLGVAAARHRENPGPAMLLRHEHILLELSLLLLDRARVEQPAGEAVAEPIERSLRWFSDRMADDPSLADAARAAGVSPAHLRRLYHRAFAKSPKALFDQVRLQRAMQLMAAPVLKLEDVAVQCGFGSASAFSRAFKQKLGCTPSVWRTQV